MGDHQYLLEVFNGTRQLAPTCAHIVSENACAWPESGDLKNFGRSGTLSHKVEHIPWRFARFKINVGQSIVRMGIANICSNFLDVQAANKQQFLSSVPNLFLFHWMHA